MYRQRTFWGEHPRRCAISIRYGAPLIGNIEMPHKADGTGSGERRRHRRYRADTSYMARKLHPVADRGQRARHNPRGEGGHDETDHYGTAVEHIGRGPLHHTPLGRDRSSGNSFLRGWELVDQAIRRSEGGGMNMKRAIAELLMNVTAVAICTVFVWFTAVNIKVLF